MADKEHPRSSPQTHEDLIGSRYALEVAFQTMKERCQKLQKRLAKVEEENTKLRLQKRVDDNGIASGGSESIVTLQDKVAQLERQKQQLAHHVFMVTCENKQLWNRVTQSAKINQSLGSQLTQISDTLNQYPTGDVTPMGQSQIVLSTRLMASQREMTGSPTMSKSADSTFSNYDPSELKVDSLEEISLKLINSFLQEKSELEDQCAQMAELRDGEASPTFNADHLRLSIGSNAGATSEDGDDIESLSLSEVQRLRDSLLRVKQDLTVQREHLHNAVTHLSRIRDDGFICQSCQRRAQDSQLKASQGTATAASAVLRYESTVTAEPESPRDSGDEEVQQQLQNIENMHGGFHRICPICGRSYHMSASFEAFHQHVVSHFEDDNLDSLQDNFVIVSPERQV